MICFVSCGRSRTGLRSLAPVNTVVYLETPDLGELLGTLAANTTSNADAVFDYSSLNGIEVAVAVSGFEASESKLTDDAAVMNFQPQFTLIAETHAWTWQVESLVANNLGRFIESKYEGSAKLDRSTRGSVEWYVWTAADGRKAYAAVSGSQVFFGNNEQGVKDCLDAKEGRSDSLMENDRLSRQYENAGGKLAFGFVSEDGVKQLAEFAGISVAIERGEEAGAQSVISSIFPQIISNSVKEIAWYSASRQGSIEDVVNIRIDPKVGEALEVSMKPSGISYGTMLDLVPPDAHSVTRYNLADPRIAFRSMLIAAADRVSPQASRFVPILGASLLEPYGVRDPEEFLANCGPWLVTVQFDPEGDEGIAIVKPDEISKVLPLLADGFRPDLDSGQWIDKEAGLLAAKSGAFLVIGDVNSVKRALSPAAAESAKSTASRITMNPLFAGLRHPDHTAVSVYRIEESPAIAADRASGKEEFGATVTDFEPGAIRRTYRSGSGFAGAIVGQFLESR